MVRKVVALTPEETEKIGLKADVIGHDGSGRRMLSRKMDEAELAERGRRGYAVYTG